MANPFQVVKDFETAVAKYCGAPYCVAVSSCTAALFTCLVYQQEFKIQKMVGGCYDIEIPNKTYIGVAQSILNAGFAVKFRDQNWKGRYQLKTGAVEKFSLWDSARLFTSNMYLTLPDKEPFVCTSHHWSKTLSIGHGGCILHSDKEFDVWARKFRFDGRTEGIPAKEDLNPIGGYHLYLLPELAASGLIRLHSLPKHNKPLPNDDYPDLSTLDIFK